MSLWVTSDISGTLGQSPTTNIMNSNQGSSIPCRLSATLPRAWGPDGDSGGTAGTPLAGMGAASSLRFNSQGHSSEIPFHGSYNQRPSQTNSKLKTYSPSHSLPSLVSQSSGVGSAMGYASLPPEGVDTTPPCIKLKPRAFNIGTWNINSMTGRDGTTSYPKIPLMEDLFSLANLDLLLITETHCPTTSIQTSQKVHVLVNSIQPPANGRS